MNSKKHILVLASYLLFVILLSNAGLTRSAGLSGEITQAQAIARARSILRNNAGPCGITQTQSVAAARAKAGWRVTAKIKMSGTIENAVWIVGEAAGASPQNQLTSEIEKGCP